MDSAVSSLGSKLNPSQSRLPPHLIGSQIYERNNSSIIEGGNSRLSDNRSMSLNGQQQVQEQAKYKQYQLNHIQNSMNI